MLTKKPGGGRHVAKSRKRRSERKKQGTRGAEALATVASAHAKLGLSTECAFYMQSAVLAVLGALAANLQWRIDHGRPSDDIVECYFREKEGVWLFLDASGKSLEAPLWLLRSGVAARILQHRRATADLASWRLTQWLRARLCTQAEIRAATTLQRFTRGCLARYVQRLLRAERDASLARYQAEAAARVLQSRWRGAQTRGAMSEAQNRAFLAVDFDSWAYDLTLLEEANLVNAATRVQSAVRAWRARTRAAQFAAARAAQARLFLSVRSPFPSSRQLLCCTFSAKAVLAYSSPVRCGTRPELRVWDATSGRLLGAAAIPDLMRAALGPGLKGREAATAAGAVTCAALAAGRAYAFTDSDALIRWAVDGRGVKGGESGDDAVSVVRWRAVEGRRGRSEGGALCVHARSCESLGRGWLLSGHEDGVLRLWEDTLIGEALMPPRCIGVFGSSLRQPDNGGGVGHDFACDGISSCCLPGERSGRAFAPSHAVVGTLAGALELWDLGAPSPKRLAVVEAHRAHRTLAHRARCPHCSAARARSEAKRAYYASLGAPDAPLRSAPCACVCGAVARVHARWDAQLAVSSGCDGAVILWDWRLAPGRRASAVVRAPSTSTREWPPAECVESFDRNFLVAADARRSPAAAELQLAAWDAHAACAADFGSGALLFASRDFPGHIEVHDLRRAAGAAGGATLVQRFGAAGGTRVDDVAVTSEWSALSGARGGVVATTVRGGFAGSGAAASALRVWSLPGHFDAAAEYGGRCALVEVSERHGVVRGHGWAHFRDLI